MASAQVLTPYATLDIRLGTPPKTPTPPRTPKVFEAALQHEATFRRTRASKPKVRTGCLTCKLRRVKCDERKPSCERCNLSGRKCDGYPLSAVLKKTENDPAMALLLRRTPNTHQGSEPEIRALEFFYRKTAPQLSGFFDADFWTRLIFQVQASDGAIRHAMIALGSLARQQGGNTDRCSHVRPVGLKEVLDPPDPNRMHLPLIQAPQGDNENFALMHYNMAIQDLSARIQSPDAPIEIVLLSCILFVSIEFLRGELHPALKHFKGGMSVAMQSLSQKSPVSTTAMHRIEQNLLPFFNRIELLSTLLGNVADWEYHVTLEEAVPKSFANMRQARDSLVHIMNLAVRFIRDNKFGRYMWQTIPPDKLAQQDAFQKQFEKWRQGFSALVMSESITAVDLGAAQVLRLQHIVSVAFLGICLRNDECKTDEWNPFYEQIVDLAEAIEESASVAENNSSSPNFLFDMEIVSPLWVVLHKCRHPIVRRRAIEVLRRTKRREGLWDSQVASIVGERIMLLEEKNLTVLDGSELPQECDRLHACHISESPVSFADTRRHIVTYFYKPDGLDGRWAVMYEEIRLA